MARRRRLRGGVDELPSGRFRARVLDETTGTRHSLGTFQTRGDADAALAKASADQGRGVWIAPDRGRVTLAEYAPRWLDARLTSKGEPLRPRVRELYEGELRLHILPAVGDLPLARLKTPTIRSWYSSMLADGPRASTAAKCYRLLRAILNTAVEDGLLAVNPCTIKGGGVERAGERVIPTVEQVYALADAPRFRALVLLAALAGLRRGELLGLTRSHVDLLHRSVTVEVQRQQSARGENLVSPPKTDAGRRTVVLPAGVIPDVTRHLEQFAAPGPDGLVFVGEKGGPLRPHVLQKEWDRARRRLGLADLHLHDLRHVAGTLAAATGAGTKELMHRLGHASPQAALRYQHATRERDAAIADAIERLIEASRSTHSATVHDLRSETGTDRS